MSDYKNNRVETINYIPETIHSPVNRVLFKEIFDKFFTKREFKKISGHIGNKQSLIPTIDESTIHRQAYQLQPHVTYTNDQTFTDYSFEDLMKLAERYGIDTSRFDEWGQVGHTNFIPPINLDKFINFTNYYWLDENQRDSMPQYITMSNPSIVQMEQKLMNVRRIISAGNPLISETTSSPNTILLENEDYTMFFSIGDTITIESSLNNNGTYQIANITIVGDDTVIEVVQTLLSATNDGNVVLPDITVQLKQEMRYVLQTAGGTAQPFDAYPFDVLPYDDVDVSSPYYISLNDWQRDNKWVHKDDIPNTSFAKRATFPILEYFNTLQMNEWSQTEYKWLYRSNPDVAWTPSDQPPTAIEITRGQTESAPTNSYDAIDFPNLRLLIDETEMPVGFTVGSKFMIYGSSEIWTVDTINLVVGSPTKRWVKVVEANLPFFSYDSDKRFCFINQDNLIKQTVITPSTQVLVLNGDISSQFTSFPTIFTIFNVFDKTANYYQATSATVVGGCTELTIDSNYRPVLSNLSGLISNISETSHGDPWRSFTTQWCFNGIDSIIPVNPQTENTTTINQTHTVIPGSPQSIFTAAPGEVFLSNNGDVRVMVNDRDLYIGFEEGWYDGVTFTAKYNINEECNAIRLYEAVDPDIEAVDVIISTHVQAMVDLGLNYVYVRTDQDEENFTPVSMVVFKKRKQMKTQVGQYPLFDVYDLEGNHTHTTNSIIEFAEDPINGEYNRFINKKIAKPSLKDYSFNILIVDENERNYCYRDSALETVNNPDGLSTIWRSLETLKVYTPRLVNENRRGNGDVFIDDEGNSQTVSGITATNGYWEIPYQYKYNIHHETKNNINFSELIQHCDSVMKSQEYTIGEYYRGLTQKDFGLGGNIKEVTHNYDRFLSNLITTIILDDVLRFGGSQQQIVYTDAQNYFIGELINVLIDQQTTFVPSVDDVVKQNVLSLFDGNDVNNVAFGDSLTYNATTGQGIKNICHTLPFLGIGKKIQPYVIRDESLNIVNIIAHDGHVHNLTEILGTIPTTQHLVQRIPGTITSTSAPSAPIEGTLWFDGSSLRRFTNATWVIIDVTSMFIDLLLTIEQSLYDVAPTSYVDTSNLVTNDNVTAYNTYMQESFTRFTNNKGIINPYANPVYDIANAFTWNYSDVDVSNIFNPRTTPVSQEMWAGGAKQIYLTLFGTSYPHLEPWKIQGYEGKPVWWDAEYSGAPARRWSTTMWSNIDAGIVPVGQTLPDGTTSTGVAGETTQYNFVCVNNTSGTTSDGYGPDDLLPPFWVAPSSTVTNDAVQLRTLIRNNAHVNMSTIANTFVFGDGGYYEMAWKESAHYLFDDLIAKYKIEPLKFFRDAFSQESVYELNGIRYDLQSGQLLSHQHDVFYGSVKNDAVYRPVSLTSLYVFYGRYNNIDLNHSNVVDVWNNWQQHLAYGTNTIIDSQTLHILNDSFDVVDNDYQVALKRVEGISDVWFTNLVVDVEKVGRRLTNTQQLQNWDFIISTSSPVPVYVDVYKSHYYALQPLTASDTFVVQDNNLTLELGEAITFTSDQYLSEDLRDQKYFFIIPISTSTFKIARTYADAVAGVAVSITDIGVGTHHIAAPSNTFTAMKGAATTHEWITVKVDRNEKTRLLLPQRITGLQNVLNFIDGYVECLKDMGIQEYNFDYPDIDASTNRRQDWQYEKELLIDTLFRYQLETYTKYSTPSSFKFIMNPYKQNMWVKTINGRLSELNNDQFNVIDRCFMYDVFGRTIPSNQMVVFRSDNTHIQSISDMNIGGGHILIDGYEHVIVFNDFTTEDVLIFSPFLGVNVEDFVVFMDAQDTANNNKIVAGGYFLLDDELVRNIEQTTNDIRDYYNVYSDVDENIKQLARESVGFKSHPVFYKLGVTADAEFTFWKGLIKQKGTINALNTLSNIQTLSDIEVDEYWAYKKNMIGNNQPNFSVDVKINPENVLTDMASFKFVVDGDSKPSNTPIDVQLNSNDISNWHLYPLQHKNILDANVPNYFWKATVDITKAGGVDNVTSSTIVGGNISHLFSIDEFSDSFFVKINVENNIRNVVNTVVADTIVGTQHTIVVPFNIINRDMLTVYVNHVPTTDFDLAYVGSSYEVTFNNIDSTIDNTFGISVKENAIINMGSELYWESYDQLRLDVDVTFSGDVELTLFGVTPSASFNNHAEIIDTLSKTTIDELRSWHPLHGDHTQSVMNNVDVYVSVDPAVYDHVESEVNALATNTRWTDNKVDLVWFKKDSYNSNYTNDVAYNTTNNSLPRFSDWGATRLGKQYGVFQWVESDIAPEQWHQIDILRREGKIVQETINTEKYIGTPLYSIQKRTRALSTDPWGSWTTIQDGVLSIYTNNGSETVDVSSVAAENEVVLVYVNERLFNTIMVDSSIEITITDIPVIANFKNKITVINPATVKTATATEEYRYVYNYSTKFKYVNGFLVERFYFWITDSTLSNNTKKTNTRQMISDLTTNPNAYIIVNNCVDIGDDEYGFNNIVLTGGVRSQIGEKDRYIVRFNLNDVLTNTSMKEIISNGDIVAQSHDMWYLIRPNQNDPVPYELWKRLMSSILQYDVDTNERLPSVERELYDANYNETTKYGFGPGCIVLDKQHIINIITSIILDPNTDITPHDKVSFINNYTFNTNEDTIRTMNMIYNSFNTRVTNKIFFTCVEDMLSVNNRTDNMFKTSFVSLTYNAELDGI